jgi:hypothetical protein
MQELSIKLHDDALESILIQILMHDFGISCQENFDEGRITLGFNEDLRKSFIILMDHYCVSERWKEFVETYNISKEELAACGIAPRV